MRKLSELVSDFFEKERPDVIVLEQPQVLALAVASTRYHAGYALIRSRAVAEGATPPAIDGELVLTWGEWALIKSHFVLHVEMENARHLEATRIMGGDVFGRQSSEIASEITQLELEYPGRAFMCEPVTIE